MEVVMVQVIVLVLGRGGVVAVLVHRARLINM